MAEQLIDPRKESARAMLHDFYKNFDDNMETGPAPGINIGLQGADQPPPGAGLGGDDGSAEILLDKFQGGFTQRMRNKALSAPHPKIKQRVSMNRLAIQLRNEERAARMRMATHAMYSNMEDERELRRLRSFRPAPRQATLKTKTQMQAIGIDNGDIPELVGTAGMESNQLPVPTSFKDHELITGRGIKGVNGTKTKPFFF